MIALANRTLRLEPHERIARDWARENAHTLRDELRAYHAERVHHHAHRRVEPCDDIFQRHAERQAQETWPVLVVVCIVAVAAVVAFAFAL